MRRPRKGKEKSTVADLNNSDDTRFLLGELRAGFKSVDESLHEVKLALTANCAELKECAHLHDIECRVPFDVRIRKLETEQAITRTEIGIATTIISTAVSGLMVFSGKLLAFFSSR